MDESWFKAITTALIVVAGSGGIGHAILRRLEKNDARKFEAEEARRDELANAQHEVVNVLREQVKDYRAVTREYVENTNAQTQVLRQLSEQISQHTADFNEFVKEARQAIHDPKRKDPCRYPKRKVVS